VESTVLANAYLVGLELLPGISSRGVAKETLLGSNLWLRLLEVSPINVVKTQVGHLAIS